MDMRWFYEQTITPVTATWVKHYPGDWKCDVCDMPHHDDTQPPQHAACAAIAAAGCARMPLGADWCAAAWHVAGNVYVCDAECEDADGLPLFEVCTRTRGESDDVWELLLTTSDGATLRAALARLAG